MTDAARTRYSTPMTEPSPDVAAILETLVGFDTVSHRSNLPLIAWVEDLCRGHAAVERVVDETGQKAALWISVGPVERPGYVLSGHSDVVPAEGQPWTSDPFTLRVPFTWPCPTTRRSAASACVR